MSSFIIFLDIDGVLNQLQHWHIDMNCISVLQEIVKMTDGHIVLSSSWRLGWSRDIKQCTPQVKSLVYFLKEYGLTIEGRTAALNNRLAEIKDYCKRHDIKHFLILDDDKTEFNSIPKNLYLVNPHTGLIKQRP